LLSYSFTPSLTHSSSRKAHWPYWQKRPLRTADFCKLPWVPCELSSNLHIIGIIKRSSTKLCQRINGLIRNVNLNSIERRLKAPTLTRMDPWGEAVDVRGFKKGVSKDRESSELVKGRVEIIPKASNVSAKQAIWLNKNTSVNLIVDVFDHFESWGQKIVTMRQIRQKCD
jgi:hypothetical protein